MSKRLFKYRATAMGSVRLASVVCVLLSLLIVIGSLALNVRQRLAALDAANSDNGQWVLMQTEVEVLRLQYALADARSDMTHRDIARIDEVRRWFDVLFSRLRMLDHSPLYSALMSSPENRARLAQMQGFVDAWVPVIDGPRDGLIAALPVIEREATEVHRLARATSLDALRNLSAHEVDTRTQMSDTLVQLAITTAAAMLFLVGLATMAMRLYRMTLQQAAENQITSARLSVIIATSPDAIVVTNRGGWLVEFNTAAEQMFGLSRDAVMGRQIVPQILDMTRLAEYQDQLNDVIAQAVVAGPQRFEMRGQRASGETFPLEISLAMRDLNRGSLIVGFLRDMSQRHADRLVLEQALTRAQAGEKAKANFLAVMSHEMRTPLNGLIGSMEVMRDAALTEDQRELLRVMEVSGDILLGHVESVLDIAHAEAGQFRLAKTSFVLDSLIDDCIANQAGVARAAQNDISHEPLTGPIGTVQGDPRRLQQILLNLIGNAVKFTRNGSIVVETERLPPSATAPHDQLVEIRVIDTGIGIAEEDIDRVFEDFVTVDTSYGRATQGTGLGLGIARRLARAMEGDIGVESEPGDGSVFWLRLPLAPAEAIPTDQLPDRAQLLAQPALRARPLDILIIEDSDINRFLLRRYLRDGSHRVVEASDGIEGVAAATASRFDLIITDISMPRLDGIEATRRIRAGGASAQARIIALTAYALPEDLERFREAGMDACLTKPVTRDSLMAHLTGQPMAVSVVGAPVVGALKPEAMAATHRPEILRPEIQPTEILRTEILRRESLAELVETLGEQVAMTLMQRMIADGDASVGRIRDNPVADDETSRIAHQLAGSCITFGAVALREALVALEHAIRTGDTAGADRMIADLPALWQDTRAGLAGHRASRVA
jgi:PAS domain S-box-containing protein